jgi:hypothetical protein
MKTMFSLTGVVALLLALTLMLPGGAIAQTCDGQGKKFVDVDGDGINDNAPDHDNDGIPNGLDPDWVKYAQDGDGYQHRNGEAVQAQNKSQAKTQNGELFQKKLMTMRWYQAMFQHRVSLAEPGDGTGLRCGFGAGPNAGAVKGPGPNGNGAGGQGAGR